MLCKCTSTILLSRNVALTNFQATLRAGDALDYRTGCLCWKKYRATTSIPVNLFEPDGALATSVRWRESAVESKHLLGCRYDPTFSNV